MRERHVTKHKNQKYINMRRAFKILEGALSLLRQGFRNTALTGMKMQSLKKFKLFVIVIDVVFHSTKKKLTTNPLPFVHMSHLKKLLARFQFNFEDKFY